MIERTTLTTTLKRLWPFGAPADSADTPSDSTTDTTPAMQRLVAGLQYEIVPMSSIEQAMADLPPAAHVSVTCSPVKGIPATLHHT